MRPAVTRAAAALPLALLAACSVVNSPGDHQELEPVAVHEFCAEFAAVVCDAHLACCSSAAVDLDDCRSAWTASCASTVGTLATDPRSGYDPRIAAEVLEEGRSFTATCSTDALVWFESRAGFQRVLSGTVAGGEECTPNEALDLPAYVSCDDLDQACLGTGGGISVCQDRRDVGEACGGHYDCTEGLFCEDFTPFILPGSCAVRLEDGAACTDDAQCASLFCPQATPRVCVTPTSDEVYCMLEMS